MAIGEYSATTALLVIDVQNDFADPNGNLYVAGGETIIDGINQEVAAARQAGGLVVYTQDWHPESTPHFDKDGGVWPVHCVRDTWGAQLHPALEVDGPVVKKGTEGGDGYSGFSVRDPNSGEKNTTRLGSILDEHGIERVYVVGLALDVCVKATVIDACERGYATTLLSHLTRPVDPDAGRATLEIVADKGAAVS
ncbi:MAG: isochorismatase family protein [Nitriliruptoraceae bacterium]